MTEPIFDFYFERAGRSGAQGPIAPAEQFFEGSGAEASLAREIGQNSLDAAAGNDPVRITFELAKMPTDSIPGIGTLRKHLSYVAEETQGSEGHTRMITAQTVSNQSTLSVLRISDFGTTGLRGSESKDSNKSALSALTRGAGISANDGARGGSFGIGSAVGPMSSDLCTVFYTSLADDSTDVVLAGYSRLASHRDENGDWRQAEGFFTDISSKDDFRYPRNPEQFGPFPIRTENGTDLFVLGYRKAVDDPSLENIRRAFLSHFLVAIYRGKLEVEGVADEGSWLLTRDSLEANLAGNPEAHAFYLAIQDPHPVTRDSERFGPLSLFIHVDDTLERSLHTITVRTPLMKIDTFKHTSIPARYAAILECSDDRGNKLLRTLEPPQHDRWDAGRAEYGDSALRELKQFVRDGLKSRVKDQLGDEVEIKGLSRYLPSQDLSVSKDNFGAAPGANEEGSTKESATVQGKSSEPQPVPPTRSRSVKVAVATTTGAAGTEDVNKGKDRGGDGQRTTSRAGIPGKGGDGSGNARIRKGDIRFRSWSDRGTGALNLALTPTENLFGDVELVAIGAGGNAEDGYALPITGVELVSGNEITPIDWNVNVLLGITLPAGKTTRLRLLLERGHRYRLDIK